LIEHVEKLETYSAVVQFLITLNGNKFFLLVSTKTTKQIICKNLYDKKNLKNV